MSLYKMAFGKVCTKMDNTDDLHNVLEFKQGHLIYPTLYVVLGYVILKFVGHICGHLLRSTKKLLSIWGVYL